MSVLKQCTKTVRGGLIGGVAALLMTLPATAQDKLEFSGNAAITSDYIFRGISQRAEDPALQGGVDATYGMFYVGAWGSFLDFGTDGAGNDIADIELDLYAGITPKLGPVDLDLGVIGYFYPGAKDTPGAELDFYELKAGASVSPLDNVTLGVTGYYSPEFTGEIGEVSTVEGNIEVGMPSIGGITPSFSALVGTAFGDSAGFQTTFGDDNYVYWNAGIGLGFNDNLSLDLRYWDTDMSDAICGGATFQCDERFVATLAVTF